MHPVMLFYQFFLGQIKTAYHAVATLSGLLLQHAIRLTQEMLD
jgi:hypothetical protein